MKPANNYPRKPNCVLGLRDRFRLFLASENFQAGGFFSFGQHFVHCLLE